MLGLLPVTHRLIHLRHLLMQVIVLLRLRHNKKRHSNRSQHQQCHLINLRSLVRQRALRNLEQCLRLNLLQHLLQLRVSQRFHRFHLCHRYLRFLPMVACRHCHRHHRCQILASRQRRYRVLCLVTSLVIQLFLRLRQLLHRQRHQNLGNIVSLARANLRQ